MQGEQVVYRLLLRAARQIDRCPQQLVTLFGWPSVVFDRRSNKVVRQAVTKCPFAEDAILEACGGSIEFSHPTGSAARAVRRHRRLLSAVGFDYMPSAQMILERLEAAKRSTDRVLAAVASNQVRLPELELEFISGPRAGSKVLLREDIADKVEGQPVAAAAESVPFLQRMAANDVSPCAVGQLLITHPLSAMAQPTLDRAVMLLADVDAGTAKGIVLNMQARGTLRSVLAAWSCRTGDGGAHQIEETDKKHMENLGPLLDVPLLSGGDVMEAGNLYKSISWLHTLGRAVPGALEVAPSVWLGGDVRVMVGLVASGKASREHIRPVLGCTRWALPQLELELQRGVWVRAHMATAELSQQLFAAPLPEDDIQALEEQRVSSWRAALMGAGLPGLADFPRGRAVDVVLRAIIQKHYSEMRSTQYERVDGVFN